MNNNFHFRENTPPNRYFLPLVSLVFLAVTLLLASRAVANNTILRSIFSCQAQGLGGAVPTITVWYQQGTNLSFIPAGETIKKVWLDDPSQVTLDFDGPMCVQFGKESTKPEDCENSAANVIHMRRIKKLPISGLPNTDTTLLTVITEGQGRKNLYAFQVIYGEGSPEYNTLAVFADPPPGGTASCVRVRTDGT
jgi:hypothetical protein